MNTAVTNTDITQIYKIHFLFCNYLSHEYLIQDDFIFMQCNEILSDHAETKLSYYLSATKRNLQGVFNTI